MRLLKTLNYEIKPMLWNAYNNHKNLIIPAVAVSLWCVLIFGAHAVSLWLS